MDSLDQSIVEIQSELHFLAGTAEAMRGSPARSATA